MCSLLLSFDDVFLPNFLLFFQICAIVGGTFTVAGIVDSLIFSAAEIFRKAELGKLS